MYKHPFRKSFGLIVLYSIIIIGIFVLQFRNESVVSKNIGPLSISYAQSQNEAGEISLKNSLQASFKGISFLADEVTPARIAFASDSGEVFENIVLTSFEQKTPLSYTFHFTHDTSLTFAVTSTDALAVMSITAELPKDALGLYLNYKPISGFSVTEKTNSKLILNSKNTTYAFSAAHVSDKEIMLSQKNLVAYYLAYDSSVQFSFAMLDSSMIIAQKSTYDANLKSLRESLVSSVEQAVKNNQTLSEKSVTAYVAEKALQGQYSYAVNYIPDSFKKGNKRTYFSSPYFNSLANMLPTLEMYHENMMEMLRSSIDTSSLSIFTIESFADYLNILPEDKQVRTFLSQTETILTDENSASQVKLSHASGILSTYLRLESLHSSLAELLLPAAQKCIPIIEENCILNDSVLTLTEKNMPVSNFQALLTGNALVKWGEINASQECTEAGYAMINSILSANTLDQLTMGDIYPILIENEFYPHYKVLSRGPASTIWAWTCATSMSYTPQNTSASISITFPKGDSHYIFMGGISPFSEIEIYGLSFRSDPRFELYNSSGFVYREKENILLLKSRQKAETEIVRLTYR